MWNLSATCSNHNITGLFLGGKQQWVSVTLCMSTIAQTYPEHHYKEKYWLYHIILRMWLKETIKRRLKTKLNSRQ